MPLYELAFVDSVATSPTTRLNLNDMTNWSVLEGTRFDPPDIKRAVVSTLMYDGARYPASAYEDRVLTLVLQITATSADTAATQLQALARELDRETNYLRYEPLTTNAVTFITHRSNFTTINFDEGSKQVTVQLLAEPFAYGVQTTALNAVTVTNNPAAATRGMYFDLEDVKGDVETPLWLKMVPGTFVDETITILSTRRWGDITLVPYFQQAEGMTADVDTSIQANDANYSGAGQNYMRTTFATTTAAATRLSIVTPAKFPPQNEESRGTYRMFGRVRKSVSGDSIRARYEFGINVDIVGDYVTLPTGTNRTWIDFGQITFPIGMDPVHNPYSSVAIPVLGDELRITAQRVSGSGNVDWDVFFLFPADDQLAVLRFPANTPGDPVWDGSTGNVYFEAVGGSSELCVASGTPIQLEGPDALMVSPGDNRVYMGILMTPGEQSDLTATTAVTAKYWPRYIHVAPVST